MIIPQDTIGFLTADYIRVYGSRARFRVDDDMSIAIGQKKWIRVRNLQRVKDRLHAMEAEANPVPAEADRKFLDADLVI